MIKKDNLPIVDLNHHVLTDTDGIIHHLNPNEFWYITPKSPGDNLDKYTNIPFLLHNTFLGKGIAPAMTDLLKGISINQCQENNKVKQRVEEIFERIRSNEYSHRPSRLRCYFLSLSKQVAEKRFKDWNKYSDDRHIIVKCYLILSSGKYHLANISEYEEATKKNAISTIEEYARSYWEGVTEADTGDKRIELLADSALYFPDWNNFPKIELANLNLPKELERKIEIFTDKGCWEQYISKI